jgi:hypothetical protein
VAITTFYVGMPLTADLLNTAYPLGEIGRAYRSTAAGPTSGTTELAILRLSNLSFVDDRSYKIVVSSLRVDLSVNTDHFKFNLRYSTSGDATTSSTVLTRSEATADVDTMAPMIGYIRPTADATYSFLVSLVRTSGTGTGTTTADDENDLSIVVYDKGFSVADTGTVL